MKKKINKLPDFNKMTREEEAHFWDTHSFTEFEDELEEVDIIFDLKKPRDETLVVRVQKDIKDRLSSVAREKGLNVSTLARMWILEKLRSLQHPTSLPLFVSAKYQYGFPEKEHDLLDRLNLFAPILAEKQRQKWDAGSLPEAKYDRQVMVRGLKMTFFGK